MPSEAIPVVTSNHGALWNMHKWPIKGVLKGIHQDSQNIAFINITQDLLGLSIRCIFQKDVDNFERERAQNMLILSLGCSTP